MLSAILPDGSAIRFLETGVGHAVVFVPMIAEMNFVYAPQMEELRRDHRVLLYQPRLSRTHHVGIADRAREIVALMDARGIDTAHIIAWSDAGSGAYYFAKTSPTRCRSAVFLGLADEYRFPQPLFSVVKLLAKTSLERVVPDALLARILAQYLGGQHVKRKWIVQRAAEIPKLARLFKHSVLPNLLEHRPLAGEVNVPTKVLCGDQDALVTLDQAHRMARLLGQTTGATVIEGGEHFLGYVDGVRVNAVVREFYNQL